MATNADKLELVDLREIWPNETQDFTPWLARNLEVLSEALGMAPPLKALATEAQTGRFSADIIAHNPADSSGVLIENQLEQSDHTHLGQIMTYLAGHNVQTIMWIARDFSKEHLSAIHWLNENTLEQFSFFAVKIIVVKFRNFPKWPLFDVMESPSYWWTHEKLAISQNNQDYLRIIRDYQEMIRRKEEEQRRKEEEERRKESAREQNKKPNARVELNRAFWTFYAERHPDDGVTSGFSSNNPRYPLGDTGLTIKRARFTESVALWLSERKGTFYAPITHRMKPYLPDLCEALDMEMDWIETMWDTHSNLPIDTRDPDNWEEAVDWLHEMLGIYLDALGY